MKNELSPLRGMYRQLYMQYSDYRLIRSDKLQTYGSYLHGRQRAAFACFM